MSIKTGTSVPFFLENDGYLINTEISVDIKSPEYDQLIDNWKAVHALTGANEEKLNNIPFVIEEQLGVITPEKTKELIVKMDLKILFIFFNLFLSGGDTLGKYRRTCYAKR